MANERTYPGRPCRDLDPAIAFYEAIGFRRAYRQLRPNPYTVVQREDLQLHLFGMPDFDPPSPTAASTTRRSCSTGPNSPSDSAGRPSPESRSPPPSAAELTQDERAQIADEAERTAEIVQEAGP